MKKVTAIVAFVFFLAISLLLTGAYSYLDTRSISADNRMSVHVEDKSKQMKPSEFISAVGKAAESEHLNVERAVYSPVPDVMKQKVTYYAYITDEDSFYRNVPLRWGKKINNASPENEFISSADTGSRNQIGRIGVFGGQSVIEIRPMSAMTGHIIGTDILLSTSDKTVGERFANILEKKYGLYAKIDSEGIDTTPEPDFPLYAGIAGLIICLLVFTAVAFLYMLASRYGEFAVRKMFGQTNRHIIGGVMLRDALPEVLLPLVVCFAVTPVILYFYNGLGGFSRFLPFFAAGEAAAAVLLLFVFLLLAQVIRNASSSSAIKGRRPEKTLRALNITTKTIFSVLAVVLCALSVQQISKFLRQNSNYQKWNADKNYAVMEETCSDDEMSGIKGDELSERFAAFDRMLSDHGALLFSPSAFYSDSDNPQYNKYPVYSPWKCSVDINGNYLRLNPIYDVSGKKVSAGDKHTKDLTVLVPEKYRKREASIKKLYTEYQTGSYYSERDKHAFEEGKNIGYDYDTAASGDVAKHHKPLGVRIIYVKNGQKYFSYDPEILPKTGNAVTDPVAMVINDANGDISEAQYYISSGSMRAKVSGYGNPRSSVLKYIGEAGITGNIILVESLYDKVDKYIHDTGLTAAAEIAGAGLSVLIVVVVTLSGVTGYLERKKKQNAVKILHGYSFFSRHGNYFVFPVIFWACAGVILSGFAAHGLLKEVPALISVAVMFIIDAGVSLAAIRASEPKKTVDTLKGA